MTHAETVAWSLIREDPEIMAQALAAMIEGEHFPLAALLVNHDRLLRAMGCECAECVAEARERALASELARVREER